MEPPWSGRACGEANDYAFALTRARRVRFLAFTLARWRAERVRSVLRGFLTGRYMGPRYLGRSSRAGKSAGGRWAPLFPKIDTLTRKMAFGGGALGR